MRRPTPLIVIAIASTFLFTASPVSAEGEKPQPSTGDYWKYTWDAKPYRGTYTYTVTAIKDVQVGGSTHNVYEVDVSGSGNYDDGNWIGNYVQKGTVLARTSDLAKVQIHFRFNVTAAPKGGGNTVYMEIDSTVTDSPPEDAFQFPLAVGDAWQTSTSERQQADLRFNGKSFPGFPQDKTESVQRSYSVPSKGEKSVSAGTFDVIVIKEGDRELWWGGKAGLTVKEIDTSGSDPDTAELISYKYTPPVPEPPGLFGGALGGTFGLLLILLIIVVVAVAVAVVLAKRRRRGVMPGAPPLTPARAPSGPPCPNCMRPMTWQAQFSKHFCANCNRYV